jgi:hypothetical protein
LHNFKLLVRIMYVKWPTIRILNNLLWENVHLLGNRYSLFGITTRSGMLGPGFESREEREIISSPNPSRADMGPTHTAVQWVRGSFPGGNETEA